MQVAIKSVERSAFDKVIDAMEAQAAISQISVHISQSIPLPALPTLGR